MIYSHDQDATRLLKFLGKPRGEIFLGVELELYVKGKPNRHEGIEKLTAAADKAIECLGSDFAITKFDGSVNGGFETVTAPAALTIHKRRWPRFFEGMKGTLMEGHDAGMHVHFTKKPFNDGQLFIFHKILNDPENEAWLVGLAGRMANQWTHFYPKGKADLREFPHGKYEALNLRPANTGEVRIFASTMGCEVFLARLEFVSGVCHWLQKLEDVARVEKASGRELLEKAKKFILERKVVYREFVGWENDKDS